MNYQHFLIIMPILSSTKWDEGSLPLLYHRNRNIEILRRFTPQNDAGKAIAVRNLRKVKGL